MRVFMIFVECVYLDLIEINLQKAVPTASTKSKTNITTDNHTLFIHLDSLFVCAFTSIGL